MLASWSKGKRHAVLFGGQRRVRPTPSTIFGSSLKAWLKADSGVFTDAAADLEAGLTQYFEKASPTFSPTTAMTIRFSYKPESNISQEVVARFDGVSDQFLVRMQGGKVFVFVASGPTLGADYFTGTTDLVDAAQHEVVVVYDGSLAAAERVKVYANGAADPGAITGTIPTSLRSATAPLTIGANAIPATPVPLDGLLSHVGIAATALSGAALTAAHTAETAFARRSIDYFSYFPLCESTGTRNDFGSLGTNHLTAVNSPGVAAGHLEIDVAEAEIGNCPVKRIETLAGATHALQATIAQQPLYLLDADGAGNPGFDCDGTDDRMTVALAVAQPFTVAGIVRMDANGDAWFGLDAADEWIGRGTDVYEIDMAGTNRTGGTAAGAWARIIAVVNGASSVVYIDGVSTITGDPGAAGAAAAFVIGASGDESIPMDGRWRQFIYADEAATVAKVAALDAYLAAN